MMFLNLLLRTDDVCSVKVSWAGFVAMRVVQSLPLTHKLVHKALCLEQCSAVGLLPRVVPVGRHIHNSRVYGMW